MFEEKERNLYLQKSVVQFVSRFVKQRGGRVALTDVDISPPDDQKTAKRMFN